MLYYREEAERAKKDLSHSRRISVTIATWIRTERKKKMVSYFHGKRNQPFSDSSDLMIFLVGLLYVKLHLQTLLKTVFRLFLK